MRPVFDERDAAIRAERIAEWNHIEGPRVGDFVIMGGCGDDEDVRRLTYHWRDSIQTTLKGNIDSSFYFGGDHVSFSGSLDSAIPIGDFVATDEVRDGWFWFFHHGWVEAHNGVSFTVPCRVFRLRDRS